MISAEGGFVGIPTGSGIRQREDTCGEVGHVPGYEFMDL